MTLARADTAGVAAGKLDRARRSWTSPSRRRPIEPRRPPIRAGSDPDRLEPASRFRRACCRRRRGCIHARASCSRCRPGRLGHAGASDSDTVCCRLVLLNKKRRRYRVLTTSLCRRLQLRVPVAQAPIGSAASPQLAAAVSDAGALGMLAATWLSQRA
ncbi:MAG: nitronate monooxygenase, partial [Streptosporangiaceae bacterium]